LCSPPGFPAEPTENTEEYNLFSAPSALSAVKEFYHKDTKILVIGHYPLVIV
jgi:hypothetical protein